MPLADKSGLNLTVRQRTEKYQPPLPRIIRLEDADGRTAEVSVVGEKLMHFHEIPEGIPVFEHDAWDRTLVGLLESMQRYYPGFSENSEIVLIWYWF